MKLQGLIDGKVYQLKGTEQKYGGDELMQVGFYVDPNLTGDFISETYHLIEK